MRDRECYEIVYDNNNSFSITGHNAVNLCPFLYWDLNLQLTVYTNISLLTIVEKSASALSLTTIPLGVVECNR